MTRTLKTYRLVLRPLGDADAEPIARQINDLEVSRWLTSVPYPYALSDAEGFLQSIQDSDGVYLGIRLQDKLIGVVSVAEHLGYWLARPFWGLGYMTEAARAVVRQHFARGASEMRSGYLIGNAGSAGVLGKLGFETTEIIESYVTSLGTMRPNQQMRLTKDRWEART